MFKSERLHVYIALALFLSMAGGGYLLAINIGGASLYALRWVCLAGGLFYLITNGKRSFWGSPVANTYLILILVTLAYGAVALSWSGDVVVGVKELFNIAFGYGIYFVLRNASAGIRDNGGIMPYFTWGMVAILLMASAEIYLQVHLPSSFNTKAQQLPWGHFGLHAPAATYGNPNNLAVLLSAGIFMFVYALGTKREKLGLALLACWTLLALWFTESRFGLLSVYLLIPFLLYVYRKNWLSFLRSNSVISCVFVVTIALILFGGYLVRNDFQPEEAPETEMVIDEEDKPLGSAKIRYNLMKNGLDFTRESKFMGTGPGQFSLKMEHGHGKHETEKVPNPHFGGLEILSQYGIGVFLGWVAWGLFLSVMLLKNIRRKPVAVPLLMLVGMLPVSMANSTFLNSPASWTYIALMLWMAENALNTGPDATQKEPKTA